MAFFVVRPDVVVVVVVVAAHCHGSVITVRAFNALVLFLRGVVCRVWRGPKNELAQR
jgi:hypothetical protein